MLFTARQPLRTALIALAAIALLIALADRRAIAQTPAVSPSPTPSAGTPGAAQTPAATAAPAQASPAAGGTEITRASDGQTIHVPLDGSVTVRLGEDLDWTVSFDPQGVLQSRPGVGTLARGVQAVLRAAQPGTTTMTAEGRPHCNPGQACAQFIVSVIVTIVVDPAGGTQQPAPSPTAPAPATPPAPPASATAAPGVALPNTGAGGSGGTADGALFAVLGAAAALLLAAGWRLRARARRRTY